MTFPSFSVGEVLTAADMNAVGLWKITTVTFNNEASKVVDNVFSADYTNYKVVVQLYGSSNSQIVFFRMINSTGTERNTNYWGTAWGTDYASGPTTLYSTGSRTTDMPIGYAGNGVSAAKLPVTGDYLVGNPWSSDTLTTLSGNWTGIDAGVKYLGGVCSGVYNSAERHRGFWVRSTTATGLYGTVSVYGYRN